MTTNEQKCPDCCAKPEEQLKCPVNEYDEAWKAFQNYEINGSFKDAFIDGYMEGYQFANALIQLRIDKEKAAAVQVAVQQERESGCHNCRYHDGAIHNKGVVSMLHCDSKEQYFPIGMKCKDYEQIQEPQNDN